jgi:hypothetical protein
MNDLMIPQVVQEAILRNRAYFRELNVQAQAYNAERQTADPTGIQVKIGFITKEDGLGAELQFWHIEDDQALEDFLFQDLLAGLDPDMDWNTLPKGYQPLIDVLEFERHCQFEGWTAVSNKGVNEMRRIIESYRFIGLLDEARALSAVTYAYSLIPDDEDPSFYDVLSQAYASASHQTAEFEDRIEDRLPLVFQFVRTHPELFGVPG